MPSYSIENLIPVIDPSAFVHPTAILIGDVIVGPHCYVGAGAVLRGDFGRIILEEGSNLQDTCVMHSFPGKDCVIETNGHVGHGAILHGCRVGYNALIGMNAVIMDDAVIGEHSLVAATTFVKAKYICPSRSLLAGSPAEIKRELSDQEIAWKSDGTAEYQELTRRCLESHREIQPLTQVQPNRPRFKNSAHKPKK